MACEIMRYKGCKCDEKLRHIVMQNDEICLSDIAPERGEGCPCIKRGCPDINFL